MTRTDLPPESIPRRTALCLECRTALFDAELCDIDSAHSVSSLDDIYGREMLVAAVWGPIRERESNLRDWTLSQQSLISVATLGGFLGLVGSWLLFPFSELIPILGGLASGATFWHYGNKLAGDGTSDYPIGATTIGLSESGLGSRGAVDGPSDLESPASATRCVAYALELHFAGSGDERVMYRDAVTIGFDVQLDGGRIARIPPGRIHLAGALHQQIDVDNVRLERYLARFDPRHRDGDAFDPLRYNVVCEQVIVPGDRIEVLSPFDSHVNPRAEPTHYREAAPSLLLPRGVPTLRLLSART